MKALLYILASLLLISCTSNTIFKKPKDLIPKDTMVNLLADLYIANASKYERNKNEASNINYLPLVYRKYKIDSTRFYTSNFYYTSKIEVYQKLFTAVKAKLNTLKKKINRQLKTEEARERIKRYPFEAYPIPNVGPIQRYDKSRFIEQLPLLPRVDIIRNYKTQR